MNFLDSTLDDGGTGTEGPERGAEARSAGAPRGGAASNMGVWGLCPQKKKIKKINIEIAYFSAFLMVSSAVAEMQD